MARNVIIVSPDPKGHFVEGTLYLGQVPKPGTIVSIKADGTYEVWNGAQDGERDEIIVVVEDAMLGKTVEDAYANASSTVGGHFYGYIPVAGDELMIRCANITGTGSGTDDAFAIGDKLIIDDGTGLAIKTTGSPESEPFKVLETVATINADTLVLCRSTGR